MKHAAHLEVISGRRKVSSILEISTIRKRIDLVKSSKKAVKSTAFAFLYEIIPDCDLVQTKVKHSKVYNFHYIKIVIFRELTKYFECFFQ